MLDLYGFNTLKIVGGGACLIGLLLGMRDGEAAVVAASCAALASIFADDLKRIGSNALRRPGGGIGEPSLRANDRYKYS